MTAAGILETGHSTTEDKMPRKLRGRSGYTEKRRCLRCGLVAMFRWIERLGPRGGRIRLVECHRCGCATASRR